RGHRERHQDPASCGPAQAKDRPVSPRAGAPPASPLVTPEWLAQHLGRRDVRVVDGSWHIPQLKRDARAEFAEAHVPGAVFFDIDAIADKRTSLPHMLPRASEFARKVGQLGIGDRDRVIVYDSRGVASAARVWWTFRAFGHDAVAVLDGGLPRWRAEGRPVESGTPAPMPPDALRRRFMDAGLDLDKPVVTSCGSGVTASVLALGLFAAGRPDVAVYDGSWTEWGGRDDTPVEQ